MKFNVLLSKAFMYPFILRYCTFYLSHLCVLCQHESTDMALQHFLIEKCYLDEVTFQKDTIYGDRQQQTEDTYIS